MGVMASAQRQSAEMACRNEKRSNGQLGQESSPSVPLQLLGGAPRRKMREGTCREF